MVGIYTIIIGSVINLSPPGWTEDDGPKDTLAKVLLLIPYMECMIVLSFQYIKDLLCNKTDMLKDYFSMEINEVSNTVDVLFNVTACVPSRMVRC